MRISDWSSDVCSSDLDLRLRDANTDDVVRADRFPNRPHHVRSEANARGSLATKPIGAPVRMIGQELIVQIAVGGMDLDPVEAGDDRLLGGIGEARQRHLDLFVAHGYWGAIRSEELRVGNECGSKWRT